MAGKTITFLLGRPRFLAVKRQKQGNSKDQPYTNCKFNDFHDFAP
jgi:hypothetical protein